MIVRQLAITGVIAVAGVFTVCADTDITVEPGMLALLKDELPAWEGTVRLTGKADVRDLSALSAFTNRVERLDMSGLEIVGRVSGVRGDEAVIGVFRANEIPSWSLAFIKPAVLILPSGVTSMGEGALACAESRSVTLPSALKYLGEYALMGCHSLETVTLPASLEEMGKGAFEDCAVLSSADLSASQLAAVPERAFSRCMSLKEIKLPATLKNIGQQAFENSGILAIVIPASVDLAEFSLAGMGNLESLDLGSGSTLSKGTLWGANMLMNLINAPADLPDLSLAGCRILKLENITSGTTTLGRYALAGSTSSFVKFGKSLTSVGDGAFYGMTSLTGIDVSELGASIPDAGKDLVLGIEPSKIILLVADDYLDVWKAHPVWGLFNVQKESGSVDDPSVMAPAIYVTSSDSQIIVKATERLRRVEIFSLSGKTLYSEEPAAEETVIDASGLGESVVVVRAAAGKNVAPVSVTIIF